jgi:gliding motility-associated-like protein
MQMETKLNRLVLILFCLGMFFTVQARHIAGGEMSYTYLGPGANPGTFRYTITLHLYRDCQSTGAQLDQTAYITIFDKPGAGLIKNLAVELDHVETVNLTTPGPCIDNAPIVCYQIGVYYVDVELPESKFGYDISYQRCCRIEDISNIANSGSTGATYTATIPGTNDEASAPQNSSPHFNTSDTVVICENNYFTYNFNAVDPEGDKLTYEFVQGYDGAGQQQPQPTQASPPPYLSLPYSFGYTFLQPMGRQVFIDPQTGLVSGVAPAAGIYVITVGVAESRNGKIINIHRKDLHIKVAACTIAAATLRPDYITCDGFTLTFRNLSNSPLIKTYDWDFGLPGATSTDERPTYTFPDTGVYRVRLITNKGQDCSDTAYSNARVFPGFFPDFDAQDGCKNVAIHFLDKTVTKYGVVDSWQWSFGYPNFNPDGSDLQNPTYAYPVLGSFTTQLIVTNSKGCRDTVEKAVNILNKPGLRVTNDTLICSIDTLRLQAIGNGSFNWSPNVAISDVNVADPLVSPDQPTMYYVTLSSAPGCVNTDSVFVNVKQFVTLDAGPDTLICLSDTLKLRPVSDALSYRWSPAETLSNPNIKNPIARPDKDITYTVTANIGKCQATDAVNIKTVPYPTVITRGDTTICFGDQAQLFASGGTSYRWLPATGLDNNRIPDPIAKPELSTTYLVAVSDNKGCPKPSIDSVTVKVIPPIKAFAGNDTAVVAGQPLQFNATGGEVYTWTPATGLNRNDIPNPVAILSDSVTYVVKVGTRVGCFAMDTVHVKVFKTDPNIFIPTAFTPNGDRLNDKLVPLPVGIASIDYFRVYDRWGQLVFSTSEIGKGWDGTIHGTPQGSDTFAWYVRGTDYTGKVIAKKGLTTLIR